MNLRRKKLVGRPYSRWEDNVEKDTGFMLHIWNCKLVAQNRIGGSKLGRICGTKCHGGWGEERERERIYISHPLHSQFKL